MLFLKNLRSFYSPTNFDNAHPFYKYGNETVVQTEPASISTMRVVSHTTSYYF